MEQVNAPGGQRPTVVIDGKSYLVYLIVNIRDHDEYYVDGCFGDLPTHPKINPFGFNDGFVVTKEHWIFPAAKEEGRAIRVVLQARVIEKRFEHKEPSSIIKPG